MKPSYLETARLMAQVAPLVIADDTFALKGGTAINLFVRDMPRLSVDLDLVLPNHLIPREQALEAISNGLRRARARLDRHGFQTHLPASDGIEEKLFVRRGHVEVKVEVNNVMRGTVWPTAKASITNKARDLLMTDLDIPVVSFEDLYGGKLVAALDRQHPRDLFDVLQLFEGEGITPQIRRAFVVYLASSNRPVHEFLLPVSRDVQYDYERNFLGMTAKPVSLDDLLEARERLFHELPRSLDQDERGFLLSLVSCDPQWELLDIPHLEELPAIRWKLQNLAQLKKINRTKFLEHAEKLATLFGSSQYRSPRVD